MPFKSEAQQDSSADKIAEHVLQKTAVSRWREAIYSGELPLAQREKLKAQMGVTPERTVAGMNLGNVNRAKARNIEIARPIEDIKNILKQKQLSKENMMELLLFSKPALEGSFSRGDHFINSTPFVDSLNSEINLLLNKQISFKDRAKGVLSYVKDIHGPKAINALNLAHEIDESTMKPLGSSYAGRFLSLLPTERLSKQFRPEVAGILAGIQSSDIAGYRDVLPNIARNVSEGEGQLRGVHGHPAVLMNEIRSTRMLSPELQRVRDMTRSTSGEFSGMTQGPLTELNIPNPRKLPGRQFAQQMQATKDAPLREIGSKFMRGLERGSKLRELGKGLLARFH